MLDSAWVTAVLVVVAGMLAGWLVLIVLARRLPPGPLRDLVAFLPACLTLVRALRKDGRVPRRAKLAVLFAGLWLASPVDLVPEVLPVIGQLDDVVVVVLALRYAARQVPRRVILEHWQGSPRLLELVLGAAREQPAAEAADRR